MAQAVAAAEQVLLVVQGLVDQVAVVALVDQVQ
jgi:hypothetical protein